MTQCGHTFCRKCLEKALGQHLRCPKCSAPVPSASAAFPNFALNELANKARKRLKEAKRDSSARLLLGKQNLTLAELEHLLDTLTRQKNEMQSEAYLTQKMLLKEFLEQLKKQKDNELFQLQKEAAVIAR